MGMLKIWIQADEISDDEIAEGLIDFDVALVYLGIPTIAAERTSAIRALVGDRKPFITRIRLIFGPDGEVCTHQNSNLGDAHRYNEFDVLFPPECVDMPTMYAGMASLICAWRRQHQKGFRLLTVPHTLSNDATGA